jgi:hypothetical protein
MGSKRAIMIDVVTIQGRVSIESMREIVELKYLE